MDLRLRGCAVAHVASGKKEALKSERKMLYNDILLSDTMYKIEKCDCEYYYIEC